MPQAWRIVKEQYAGTAFTGEGAARTGGRWNSRGVPMVYTSGTRPLAVLETLVHLNPPIAFQYVIIPVQIPEHLIIALEAKALPADWRTEPPPPSTQRIGDFWVRQQRSTVLAVPSVILPDETNFLLNPAHADFKEVVIGKPERFSFDPRLLSCPQT